MTLKYPLSSDENSDYITFRHAPYVSNQKMKKQGRTNASPPQLEGQAIRLYVPESTPSVSNDNNWAGKSFTGPLGLVMTGAARAAIGDGSGMKQVGENIGGAASQLYVQTIAQAAGMDSASDLTALGGKDGHQIYNPNIELLYQTPVLRSVSFGFRMVAATAQETATIQNIILEFKKWSAPENKGDMFDVPHVWEIQYKHPEFMGKFKRCALTNVSVQANASSAYHTTHLDGAPVEYSLGLGFMETDIITREDHTDGIGF